MTEDNNLKAAVDKVAETISPTINPIINPDGGPVDKQVLIRATEYDRQRWREAADKGGETLSGWIRSALTAESTRILDCAHPSELIRVYPWSKTCTLCGKRLS